MTKNFKIARKPGQTIDTNETTATSPAKTTSRHAPKTTTRTAAPLQKVSMGVTTRKTIEVPEEYFYQVKMRALERRILEKELWAEILQEYFESHPAA